MKLEEQLIRDEGNVPYAYQDSEGYWTIGVGFLIDKDKGGRLPDVVRDFWLKYVICRKREELESRWPFFNELDEVRQDALLNMAFNLGVSGLLAFKKTLALIESGDFDAASSEMLDSRWAKQVGKRAERLAEQLKTGIYQ
jgi:lysozyme